MTSDHAELPAHMDVDGVLRPAVNSRGWPIHPTEDGIRNFWRWYEGSSLLDEQGRPIVLFRGMTADIAFVQFRPTAGGSYGDGIYLSDDPEVASFWAGDRESEGFDAQWGGVVFPCYARIERPADAEQASAIEAQCTARHWRPSEVLRERGFDGVCASDEGLEVMVLDGRQVKSALANTGSFDPCSEDLCDQPLPGLRDDLEWTMGA